VHRQTNRHLREISEIVPAHTRAEITRTPLRCGGDECDADLLSLLIHTYIHRHTSMDVCLFVFLSIPDSWLPNSDSLSLLIQSYIPTCMLVCVCMYIFVPFLFVFLSRPCSWLPNSLCLLDTGSFICTTTSCSACRSVSSSGAHCHTTKAPSRARPYRGQWPSAAAASAATTPVHRSSAQAPAPRKLISWIFRRRE
jgi:hypothetical protein